jgi:hypothetical protein
MTLDEKACRDLKALADAVERTEWERSSEVHMGVSIDIEGLIDSMKAQLREIARRELGGYVSRLLGDVKVFIAEAIGDVRVWAGQMVGGQLSQAEFSFLVGGLTYRMALHAITQAGTALVTLQRIRNAVIDLLISSVLKILVP